MPGEHQLEEDLNVDLWAEEVGGPANGPPGYQQSLQPGYAGSFKLLSIPTVLTLPLGCVHVILKLTYLCTVFGQWTENKCTALLTIPWRRYTYVYEQYILYINSIILYIYSMWYLYYNMTIRVSQLMAISGMARWKNQYICANCQLWCQFTKTLLFFHELLGTAIIYLQSYWKPKGGPLVKKNWRK